MRRMLHTLLNKSSTERRSAGASETVAAVELPIRDEEILPAVSAGAGGMAALVDPLAAALYQALPAAWADLDGDLLRLMTCATLAHRLKPYGPGSDADLEAMLAADTLDCSNYGLLTHHFARLAGVPVDADLAMRFVGWEKCVIGNHQTVFAGPPGDEALLLDPTLGLYARATFDSVAAGVAIQPSAILVVNPKSDVAGARNELVGALTEGAFRPSQLLYYFDSLDHLRRRYGHPDVWPTPGALAWRDARK